MSVEAGDDVVITSGTHSGCSGFVVRRSGPAVLVAVNGDQRMSRVWLHETQVRPETSDLLAGDLVELPFTYQGRDVGTVVQLEDDMALVQTSQSDESWFPVRTLRCHREQTAA